MAIPLDVAPNATIKKPGDFRRRGVDGPPYVPSLTKTRQPQGNKADLLAQCEARGIDVPTKATVAVLKELLGTEPSDELYGRPSGFGEPLENSYALRKHIERGIGAGVIKLVLDGLDPAAVDLEDPDALDRLVLDAQDAVESMIWADRGTHVHALIERVEKGESWEDLIPAGEALGIPYPLQRSIAYDWVAFRAPLGLTSVRCELPVVNDDLRIAGTLDLLDLCGRSLDTEFGRIEAGQAVIGDIKTGDARDKFAVQIAGYQGGVPFDTETEQRGEWPVRPISDIGLIYHMSMKAVLDGAPVEWQAIPVDLAAGRDGARICVEARDWPARPVFGAPIAVTSESAPMTQPTAVEPEDDAPPPAPAVETYRTASSIQQMDDPYRAASRARRDALRARVARIEANAVEPEDDAPPPAPTVTPSPPEPTLSNVISEHPYQSPTDSGSTVESRDLHGAPLGDDPSCSDGSTATLGRADWTSERSAPAVTLTEEQEAAMARQYGSDMHEVCADSPLTRCHYDDPDCPVFRPPPTRAELKARVARIEANAQDLGWHAEFTAQWRSFGITKKSTDAEILAALDAIEPPFNPDPQPEVESVAGVPCPACGSTETEEAA